MASFSDWYRIHELNDNENTYHNILQKQKAWSIINKKFANCFKKKLCFEIYINEYFNKTQFNERVGSEIQSKYNGRTIYLDGVNRNYNDENFKEIYNKSIKEKQNILSKNFNNIVSLYQINTDQMKLYDDIIMSINNSVKTFITKEEIDIIIIKYIIYHMLYIDDIQISLYLK